MAGIAVLHQHRTYFAFKELSLFSGDFGGGSRFRGENERARWQIHYRAHHPGEVAVPREKAAEVAVLAGRQKSPRQGENLAGVQGGRLFTASLPSECNTNKLGCVPPTPSFFTIFRGSCSREKSRSGGDRGCEPATREAGSHEIFLDFPVETGFSGRNSASSTNSARLPPRHSSMGVEWCAGGALPLRVARESRRECCSVCQAEQRFADPPVFQRIDRLFRRLEPVRSARGCRSARC